MRDNEETENMRMPVRMARIKVWKKKRVALIICKIVICMSGITHIHTHTPKHENKYAS